MKVQSLKQIEGLPANAHGTEISFKTAESSETILAFYKGRLLNSNDGWIIDQEINSSNKLEFVSHGRCPWYSLSINVSSQDGVNNYVKLEFASIGCV